MRIGTYNIRYDTPHDGTWSWRYRRSSVLQQIRHMDADLFGVDEALDHQYQDLRKQLPDYQSIGIARDDGLKAGEFNLLFYKQEQLQALASGHEWLSNTPNKPSFYPGAGCRRILVWAVFKVRASQQRFLAIVTHLDNASAQARTAGVQQIVRLFKQPQFKDLPVIVLGDFNMKRSDRAYQEMTETLRDSTADRQGHSRVGGTYQDDSEFHSEDPSRFSQIDYLFVNSGFQTRGVTTGRDLADNGLFPSDHFPVWGEYRLGS